MSGVTTEMDGDAAVFGLLRGDAVERVGLAFVERISIIMVSAWPACQDVREECAALLRW